MPKKNRNVSLGISQSDISIIVEFTLGKFAPEISPQSSLETDSQIVGKGKRGERSASGTGSKKETERYGEKERKTEGGRLQDRVGCNAMAVDGVFEGLTSTTRRT